MATLLVPLAQGFEETEAVTVIDVLRRAGIEVIVAGLSSASVTGSHQITVACDKTLEEVDKGSLDGIVLPGGMPGTTNLIKSSTLREILIRLDRENLLIAAICAAPKVLEAAGVLEGRKRTSFPGVEKDLGSGPYLTDAVVEDGNLITSRGPATAMVFALAIVGKICGSAKADELRKALLA